MKECPTCSLCYENAARFCPSDGTQLVESFMGGREIDGRWRLERAVGMGRHGTVYAAVDLRDGREALVKAVLPTLFGERGTVDDFLADAKRLEGLDHPNAARLYGAGRLANGGAYVAVEYLQGPTLREELADGPLAVDRALAVAVALAGALDAAHRIGVLHGDVKPENIFLEPEGDGETPKLADFEAARWIYGPGGASVTETGSLVVRLPHYTSPEQTRGERGDERSDIYSLGCVLHEMLAGKPPFDAPTPMAVFVKHVTEMPEPPSRSRAGIPAEVDRVVARALEKEPAARFRSAAEMAEALRCLCLPAAAPAPGARTARLPKRPPAPEPQRKIPPPPAPLPMRMTIVDADDESHVSRRIDGVVRDVGENGMRIETGTVMTGQLSVIRDHTTAFKNRLEIEIDLPAGTARMTGFAAWYKPAPDGINWNVGVYIRDMPAADRARYNAYLQELASGA